MESTTKRITDYFGENVFNDEVMQEYMSLDTYKELREVIDSGKSLGLRQTLINLGSEESLNLIFPI